MSTLRTTALLCVWALAPVIPAFAEIYSANDPSIKNPTDGIHFVTGTGNVTIDPVRDLAWLDITLTTGLSYDDVLPELEKGGQFEGYRVARSGEVGTLYEAAGISQPNYHTADQSPAISWLQSCWGVTAANTSWHDPQSGNTYPPGDLSDVISSSKWKYNGTWLYEGGILHNELEPGAVDLVCAWMQDRPSSYKSLTTGIALVRPASEVPEPNSLVLASLGLLGGCGMACVRRRRRMPA